jgi:hypothetical protein
MSERTNSIEPAVGVVGFDVVIGDAVTPGVGVADWVGAGDGVPWPAQAATRTIDARMAESRVKLLEPLRIVPSFT